MPGKALGAKSVSSSVVSCDLILRICPLDATDAVVVPRRSNAEEMQNFSRMFLPFVIARRFRRHDRFWIETDTISSAAGGTLPKQMKPEHDCVLTQINKQGAADE